MFWRIIKLELDSEVTTFVMIALYLSTFLVRTMSTVIILEINKIYVLLSKWIEIVDVLKLY